MNESDKISCIRLKARLARIKFASSWNEIVSRFVAGVINADQYLDELELLLAVFVQVGEDALGKDDFHKVFGSMSVDSMIDREKFKELYK